jgi:hypothetical protein
VLPVLAIGRVFLFLLELYEEVPLKFQVLKPFYSGKLHLQKGQVIDLAPSIRINTLVSTRFLMPTDAEVSEVVEQASNENTLKAQKKGRASKALEGGDAVS